MGTWIFRGDYKRFAIDDYVQNYSDILWPLNNNELFRKINSDDNIFLFSADQFHRETGRVWAKTGLSAKLETGTKGIDTYNWSTDFWVHSYPALKLDIHSVRFDVGFMDKLLADDVLEGFTLTGGEQTYFSLSSRQEEILNKMWYIDSAFIPFTSHSWYVQSSDTAIKKLDRSTFIHHMTGIPKEVRVFFSIEEMKRGEKRDIILRFKGKNYSAVLEMDGQKSPRSRLVWKPLFTEVLRSYFPRAYQAFNQDRNDDLVTEGIQMQFKRVSSYLEIYQVELSYLS